MRRGALAASAISLCLVLCTQGAALAKNSYPRNTSNAGTTDGGYYLALGDSVPVWDGTHSYPYLIAKHERAGLQVVDRACSGATSTDMLDQGCGWGPGSQYQNALSFLEAHQGGVSLITIDIGGNDLLPCMFASNVLRCVTTAITTVQTNLTTILDGLRAAAGPQVPIVGMNYFDPLLGDWLSPAGSSAQTLLTESETAIQLLNSGLADVYSGAGSPVADVYDAFNTSNLTRLFHSKWGRVPLAVKKACSLLDISCQAGHPEGFGDDPNDAGARVIARAFDEVVHLASTPA